MNLVFVNFLRRFERVAAQIASALYFPLATLRGRSVFRRRDGDTVSLVAAVLGVL